MLQGKNYVLCTGVQGKNNEYNIVDKVQNSYENT
jgi:hypothetical protein